MPDEITPGSEAGQGAETPANGDKGFDYERAYNELRPEFTRTTQDLSDFRSRLSEYEGLFEGLHSSDPEVQRAALEALGLELDEGSPGTGAEDEFVDPLEQELHDARARIEALESAREQEAAASDAQRLTELRDQYIGEAISLIEDSLEGFEFSEHEERVLGNLAIAMPDEDGLPNVQAAYMALYGPENSVLELNRQRWIEPKLGASQAPLGTTIPADQRPKTRSDRVAYVDERLAQIQRQQ